MEKKGCFLFLSHSSKNIDEVRRIRNEFEKYGENPIAFHLRCLDENYKGRDEELWKLIYREIDAREWFVYCKSPESEQSENVQKELDYIRLQGKDKVWILDLNGSWRTIQSKIERIVDDLTVVISYVPEDVETEKVLRGLLLDADYSVVESCHNHGKVVSDEIDFSKIGAYIALISDNSIRYPFFIKNVIQAYETGACLFPNRYLTKVLISTLLFHALFPDSMPMRYNSSGQLDG